MTEKELFAAIHEYGAICVGSYSHAPVTAARDKLLEAIRDFARADFRAAGLRLIDDKTLDELKEVREQLERADRGYDLFRAKAAVCDAFMAPQSVDYDRDIGKAIKALHALQEKAP